MDKVNNVVSDILELKDEIEKISIEYKDQGIHYSLNIFAPSFFASTFCKNLNEEQIDYLFKQIHKIMPIRDIIIYK